MTTLAAEVNVMPDDSTTGCSTHITLEGNSFRADYLVEDARLGLSASVDTSGGCRTGSSGPYAGARHTCCLLELTGFKVAD